MNKSFFLLYIINSIKKILKALDLRKFKKKMFVFHFIFVGIDFLDNVI